MPYGLENHSSHSAYYLYDPKLSLFLYSPTAIMAGTVISGRCKMDDTTCWIDNRYLFVRDAYEKDIMHFQHIDGKENLADGLTKALD
jgi:hypothetical protein